RSDPHRPCRPRLCHGLRSRDIRRAGTARNHGARADGRVRAVAGPAMSPEVAPCDRLEATNRQVSSVASDAIHLESFLEMLAVERGAAQNTLESYRRDLEDFSGFLRGEGRSVLTAATETIATYLRDLNRRGFAASSQARRLSALRQFFKFLYAEGLRKDDPTRTLRSPKQRSELPHVLSVEEVDRLIEAARTAAETPHPTQASSLRALRLY